MRRQVLHVACVAAVVGIALAIAPAAAQQKTAKQCDAEWKANKAAIQAGGKTKKVFVAECRGLTDTAAKPAQPTSSAAGTSGLASPPTPAATTNRAAPRQTYPTATTPSGGGQFATEIAAKAHCPSDTVVWANLESHVYHFNGTRDYGHTKRGAYMCEREASGFRAAKNEKHP
jgi:hypothetical protein